MFLFFFFFQAEDGIRDIGVTGVQTCALPISSLSHRHYPLFQTRIYKALDNFVDPKLSQEMVVMTRYLFSPASADLNQTKGCV